MQSPQNPRCPHGIAMVSLAACIQITHVASDALVDASDALVDAPDALVDASDAPGELVDALDTSVDTTASAAATTGARDRSRMRSRG